MSTGFGEAGSVSVVSVFGLDRCLMGPAFSGQLFSGISCCELAAQVLVVDLVWGLVAESRVETC